MKLLTILISYEEYFLKIDQNILKPSLYKFEELDATEIVPKAIDTSDTVSKSSLPSAHLLHDPSVRPLTLTSLLIQEVQKRKQKHFQNERIYP